MSVPITRIHELGGDLDRLYQDLLHENRGLATRLAAAKRVSRWRTAPLPRFAVRTRWPARVIPIGNAAAALEPIGGEGIGLAMGSAQLAAQSLVSCGGIAKRFDVCELIRAYQDLWTTRRFVCRAGALAISNPSLARMAVRLLRLNQLPGSVFLSLTGKRGSL